MRRSATSRSVRVWASGADAMPPELAERFKKMGATLTVPLLGALGEAAFAEGYGMVEVGGGVAAKVSPPFLGAASGLLGESFGFALPGYDLRVVDDDGHEVAAGQVGELQVKGPGVLKAYWGDEAATAAVLTDDGWLRTGDLAQKGPLGLLVFEGRSKHVIKHGGYSVYALEVEQVLEQHPDVLEAAVVGLPDEKLGEVPAAVVRLRRRLGHHRRRRRPMGRRAAVRLQGAQALRRCRRAAPDRDRQGPEAVPPRALRLSCEFSGGGAGELRLRRPGGRAPRSLEPPAVRP